MVINKTEKSPALIYLTSQWGEEPKLEYVIGRVVGVWGETAILNMMTREGFPGKRHNLNKDLKEMQKRVRQTSGRLF